MSFLLHDSAFYGGALAISRFFRIITLPILTRIFAKGEYGIVDAVTIWAMVVQMIIAFGQDSTVARFYYDSDCSDKQRQIISQSLAIELLLGLLICVPLYLLSNIVMISMTGSAMHADLLRYAIIACPLLALVAFFQNLLKWTFAKIPFAILSLGFTFLTVALTIFCVVVLRTGPTGVFIAQIVASVIAIILGFIFCKKLLAWPTRPFHYSELMCYGWPYMVLAVAACLIPAADRFFITHSLGLDVMGVYAVGFKYAYLLMLPVAAFHTAWNPFSFAIYKETNAERTYNKALLYFVGATSLILYCMVALDKPLILLMASSRFQLGSTVVFPLATGVLLNAISQIASVGIDLSKKTSLRIVGRVTGLGIMVAMVPLMLSEFGIVGVAWAVCAGQLVQAFVSIYLGHKAYPLKFSWRIPSRILFFTLVLSGLVEWAPLSSVTSRAVLGVTGLALLVLVVASQALTSGEHRLLLNIVRKAASRDPEVFERHTHLTTHNES